MAKFAFANTDAFSPGPGSQSFFDWRCIGSPMSGPAAIWNCPYQVADATPTATTIVVGRLYAMPFPVSRRCTIDTLAVELTAPGTAGSVTRMGIYQAISRTNFYPSALVVDGGEWDTTVAASVLTKSVNVTLGPDALYWIAIICGVASPTLRVLPHGAQMVIGVPSTVGAAACSAISTNPGYGALSSVAPTFPASGSFNNNTQPQLLVHFSA